MPSGRPEVIPAVISLLRQIEPRSILDVGVGFGKWGVLFREYTDIVLSEKDPPRYEKSAWRVKIDGVEGHSRYVTPLHEFVYDALHEGDIVDLLPGLGEYDMLFFGDVIEHLEKDAGRAVITEGLRHTRRYMLLTTPRTGTRQGALCGNPLERHRSVWSARDFRALAEADVFKIDGDALLAVYRKPGERRIRPVVRRRPSRLRRCISAALRPLRWLRGNNAREAGA